MGFFLPKLTQPPVTGNAITGTWVAFDDITQDFIGKIGLNEFNMESIASFIPNMWSRVVLFQKAQEEYQQGGVITAQSQFILGELKGLLALIALRNAYGWDVQMETYRFSGRKEINTIAKALYISDWNEDNDSLHLIKFDNKIIGGCLNSQYYTGFFTAALYRVEEVPWFDAKKGILRCPLETGKTGEWTLEDIRNALALWERATSGILHRSILSDWRSDINASAGGDFKVAATPLLSLVSHPLAVLTNPITTNFKAGGIFLQPCDSGGRKVLYYSEECEILPITVATYQKLRQQGEIKQAFDTDKMAVTVGAGEQKFTSAPYDKRELLTSDQMSSIYAWPNFKADDWHDYYLWELKKNDIFTIQPLFEGEGEVVVGETNVSRAFSSKKPFLGISLKLGEREIGIVEVKYKEIGSADHGAKFTVGLDFGTTHTFIAIKDEKGEAMGLSFPDRTIAVINPKSGKEEKFLFMKRDDGDLVYCPVADFATYDFMPTGGSREKKGLPITTLYKRKVLGPPEKAKDSVLEGVAVVVPDKRFYPYGISKNYYQEYDVLMEVTNPFVEGIKWSIPRDRHYLLLYLEHLLLLIRAELRIRRCDLRNGIGNILRWSYPLAMDVEQRKEISARILGGALAISESEAVSYFYEAPRSADTPGIAVDIGGGTTDISLWSRGEVKAQTSVRIAGNVCSKYVAKHPHILADNLEHFSKDLRDDDAISSTVTNLLQRMPENTLSVILSRYGEQFASFLTRYGHTRVSGDLSSVDETLLPLRQLLEFSYASIFYYLGLTLKSLDGIDTRRVEIYRAGNGWDHLNWVFGSSGASGEIPGTVGRVMKDALVLAFGSPMVINIRTSEQPKQEVAKGLLSPAINWDIAGKAMKENPNSSIAIFGEDGFEERGSKKSFCDFIATGTMITDNVPDSFNQYEKFVSFLQNFHGAANFQNAEIPSSGQLRDHIQDRIRTTKTKVEEPPFFMVIATAIKKIWKIDL
ncbi:MAG: rod shape-determining protein [Deltaproteobacteria bacterium]|nr:rod shape-determining protein [Deltaproteobacteria bacterium]